jgi:O-antigen/teichoic acid export membrane protein
MILGTAFLLRIFAALAFLAGINVVAWIIGWDETARLLIFIISWSILWKSFDVIEFYFQSRVFSEKIAKIHIASNVITSLVKIVLVLQHQPLIYFAMAYTLEWFVNAAGLYLFYSREKSLFQWKFSKHVAIILLRNSWYLLVSGLAVDLYMRVDQIMIRELIGDAANGYYAVATRISEMWYAIPMITGGVLFPALLNAKNTNRELFDHRILNLFGFMFWTALVIAIIITPFSNWIIVFLYTEEYAEAGAVLSIHIWTGIFVFWGVCTTYWSLSEDLQYISLIRTVCGLIINISLNLVLIPRYGINGAAIATLFSQAMASSFSLLIFRKTRKMFFTQLRSITYPLYLLRK